MFYRDGRPPAPMDGRQARTETKNKQAQNKPVNARKNKSRVFTQDKRKRPKKRRLRALKRKPRTKARKQNAKQAEKATAERSERIENGRKRYKHGKTAGNPRRETISVKHFRNDDERRTAPPAP